ncbi:unnamed protein product, partial [Polarella glacialis]
LLAGDGDVLRNILEVADDLLVMRLALTGRAIHACVAAICGAFGNSPLPVSAAAHFGGLWRHLKLAELFILASTLRRMTMISDYSLVNSFMTRSLMDAWVDAFAWTREDGREKARLFFHVFSMNKERREEVFLHDNEPRAHVMKWTSSALLPGMHGARIAFVLHRVGGSTDLVLTGFRTKRVYAAPLHLPGAAIDTGDGGRLNIPVDCILRKLLLSGHGLPVILAVVNGGKAERTAEPPSEDYILRLATAQDMEHAL